MIAHGLRRRIESEQRVRTLQSDLSHVSRLSTMGALASEMAHELNQPLTAVLNYAQASRRRLEAGGEAARETVIDYLEKTAAQASRASRPFVQERRVQRRRSQGRGFWSLFSR